MTRTRIGKSGAPAAIALAVGLAATSVPLSAAAQQPAAPVAAPVQPAPDDALARTYDEAFAALLAGQLDAAAVGFDEVARGAADPGLRKAAAELSRLTRELRARRVRLVTDGVGPRARPPDPGFAVDQVDTTEGRTGFVVSTTLASVYGSAVLIDVLDIDDFRPGVALVLGGTTAGFLGSYFGSSGRRITSAMADAYSYGLTLGVANGLLLASPVGVESSEGFNSLAFGAMTLGGAGAMMIARESDATRGQVSLVSLSSILGIATTGLMIGITEPDFDDEDNYLLLLAAGLDAGALAGMTLGKDIDWSVSRARLIGLGTFLGALGGWGVTALGTGTETDDDTPRLWASGTLVGMWGGFALTTYLTRGMTPDRRFVDPGGFGSGLTIAPAPVRGGAGLTVAGSF